MKKIISTILVLLTVVTLISAITSAAAAAAFPALSASSYCEFTATRTIPVFRDSARRTRGTSSPAQSYNAEIWNGDVCQIIELTADHAAARILSDNGRI